MDTDFAIKKKYGQFQIDSNILESEHNEEVRKAVELGDEKKVNELNIAFESKKQELENKLKNDIITEKERITEKSKRIAIEAVETDKKQKQANTLMDKVRNHLRGFSRTIPSFIMGYGDENTTIENFDKIIPDNVFKDVTSITLEEFRKLRDGFDYKDEDGNIQHYNGFFDRIVFNDSISEFLELKSRLANYFDEEQKEDIFDYIPPQKTNQIFTPKKVVKEMVNNLEKENPGCYDDPENTFIDLYMKSGLYITEIVKKLFNSAKLKEKYPDKNVRLNHIFEKQVYGLAPTEIIYKIATSFILGFGSEYKILKHNFKMLDALPYAQNGTLEQKLDNFYGGKNER
jgi:hypothetical protein